MNADKTFAFEEMTTGGIRPLSGGLSLLVHGCAVLLLFAAPAPQFEPKPKKALEQFLHGKEQKLVWYHFKEKLPEVKPVRSKKDSRPLRAEVRMARQSIVSSPKHAPKAPQMVWQQAPEIKTDIKFDSANLIAVSLPKVEPPKEFVPPVPQPKKLYIPQPDVPAPPDLQTAPDAKPVEVAKSELPRAVRDFQAPKATPKAKAGVREVEVAAPPELRSGVVGPKPVQVAEESLAPVARPLREFRAPAARPKAGPPAIQYVDPSPALVASSSGPKSSLKGEVFETSLGKVYRPFNAPVRKGHGKPGVAVPVLPSAPPLDASGNAPGDLNMVVVGLNPGNNLPALPPVSRPADFSAGPKLKPKGGTGDAKGNAALSVPDLTIRSGNIDSRASIMARNTIPKPGGVNEALREAAKYITIDDIGRRPATRVSNAPDSRFDGRNVFMMAIQMPNITSYSGSWLMWYSERTARPISTAVITPPTAHRKVDPKYIAEAVSERIEGIVRLGAVIRKDGTVGAVELVRGLDQRLDRSAQDALAKWQFTPAMRNGEPIDVDVLVEIPFRLAPHAEK